MTVQECYEKFAGFLEQGKGDYEVVTEGGCVELNSENIEVWDKCKQINL